MGPGLDGGEGIDGSTSALAAAGRRSGRRLAGPLPPAPAAARAAAGGAGRLAGDRLHGSLVVLFVAALWRLDPFTGRDRQGDSASRTSDALARSDVYRDIAQRTVGIARAVTVTDTLLAFPIAFYMAKIASPRVRGAARGRGADAAVVELPGEGLRLADDPRRGGDPQLVARPVRARGARASGNVAIWLVFTYLWLPFMILPIYAGLERIPDSLLDASGDLGGRPVARPSAG